MKLKLLFQENIITNKYFMNYQLEVIAFSISSCIIAEQAGADRIELCDNPSEGGTTPSFGMIKTARSKTSIALFPIIRPRGGDFLYSNDEFEIMKNDINICKTIGCDGVVIGLLKPDGSIDVQRTVELVELAYPMDVTFHRAFDRVNDPIDSLEKIINCGCKRVLTSGLHPTAEQGIDLIEQLVTLAGNRISIMPGSGIRAQNLEKIASKTKALEFHSSARKILTSSMQYSNPSMKESLVSSILDEYEVFEMKKILNNLA
jgi:copper homeostasis protein